MAAGSGDATGGSSEAAGREGEEVTLAMAARRELSLRVAAWSAERAVVAEAAAAAMSASGRGRLTAWVWAASARLRSVRRAEQVAVERARAAELVEASAREMRPSRVTSAHRSRNAAAEEAAAAARLRSSGVVRLGEPHDRPKMMALQAK